MEKCISDPHDRMKEFSVPSHEKKKYFDWKLGSENKLTTTMKIPAL
jgi:hypothetical protein